MPDKYDQQIVAIRAGQISIKDSWFAADGLFDYADRGMFAGAESLCLTAIKLLADHAHLCGFSEEFVTRIQLDDRIPDDFRQIKDENLEAFAEYQREIDRTLPSVREERV